MPKSKYLESSQLPRMPRHEPSRRRSPAKSWNPPRPKSSLSDRSSRSLHSYQSDSRQSEVCTSRDPSDSHRRHPPQQQQHRKNHHRSYDTYPSTSRRRTGRDLRTIIDARTAAKQSTCRKLFPKDDRCPSPTDRRDHRQLSSQRYREIKKVKSSQTAASSQGRRKPKSSLAALQTKVDILTRTFNLLLQTLNTHVTEVAQAPLNASPAFEIPVLQFDHLQINEETPPTDIAGIPQEEADALLQAP